MRIFIKNGKSLPTPINIDVGIDEKQKNIITPYKGLPIKTNFPLKWRISLFIKKNFENLKKIIKFYTAKKKFTVNKKYELFKTLGGKCVSCGFSDYRALQIDHVKSDGSTDRHQGPTYWKQVLWSVKHNEGRYQLLCANCNWIKRETHGELRKLKLR